MLASVKKNSQKVKSSAIKAAYSIKRFIKKHKKKLIIILVTLCSLALIAGLILGALHGV